MSIGVGGSLISDLQLTDLVIVHFRTTPLLPRPATLYEYIFMFDRPTTPTGSIYSFIIDIQMLHLTFSQALISFV